MTVDTLHPLDYRTGELSMEMVCIPPDVLADVG